VHGYGISVGHRSAKRHRVVFSLLLLLLIIPPTLQGQVVKTSSGTVEFLGLEEWTPKLIQERLGYKSADELHFCMNDLKKAGFADAAVVVYREQGRRYTVITVVEPQYAADVVYGARPEREISVPKSWEPLRRVVEDPRYLEGGVLDYASTLPGARAVQPPLADGGPQDWWPALRARAEQADYEKAQEALNHAADPVDRAAAALVLMNFPDRHAAWQNLIRGLRDPEIRVSATCLQSLHSLSTYVPRKIDWAPVLSDIGYLLRGTNLFAFRLFLNLLTLTHVDPAFARPLMENGGGRLVLAYLRAGHQAERDAAHAFLVQLRGGDLGNDPSAWATWIQNLSEEKDRS